MPHRPSVQNRFRNISFIALIISVVLFNCGFLCTLSVLPAVLSSFFFDLYLVIGCCLHSWMSRSFFAVQVCRLHGFLWGLGFHCLQPLFLCHPLRWLFNQRFHEYPYLSIDHLKMGLIRSGHTEFTPLSADTDLTAYLWPIVREIIKTAIENRQNLIVEGCCIPFDRKIFLRRISWSHQICLHGYAWGLYKKSLCWHKGIRKRDWKSFGW